MKLPASIALAAVVVFAGQPVWATGAGTLVLESGRQHAAKRGRSTRLTKTHLPPSQVSSFNETQPTFLRLLGRDWYTRQRHQITRMQKLANGLTEVRRIPGSRRLDKLPAMGIDLEATGLDDGKALPNGGLVVGNDEIVEIGLVETRNGQLGQGKGILIRPEAPMDPNAQAVHGISTQMLKHAPPIERVAEHLLTALQGKLVIGHNVLGRDVNWLRSDFARLGVDFPEPTGIFLDTMRIAMNVKHESYTLAGLAKEHNIPVVNAHRAVSDAELTIKVFWAEVKHQGIRTLEEAFAAQQQGNANMLEHQAMLANHAAYRERRKGKNDSKNNK